MTSSRKWCAAAVLAAVVCAAAIRLPRLATRPMHGDEAVGAVKFGALFEENYYRYDPYQYHGPTLNYFTLVPACLAGCGNFEQVTETTLRIVPAVFGVLLVAMVLLTADGIGPAAAVFAAILAAASNALVFYSRFYVHEMLLVAFTFGVICFGWRCLKTGKVLWAAAAGLCAGLAHATKETFIIALAAMVAAAVAAAVIRRPAAKETTRPGLIHLVAAIAAAAAVSCLFYCSFFTNAAGIRDSVSFVNTYIGRAASGDEIHLHPWYYYLKMLAYSQFTPGVVWSEALILVLAAAGFLAAMKGRIEKGASAGLAVFIALYTLIMTVVYSAISYKTPWCMLGFLHVMVLLAGIGAAAILKSLRRPFVKAAAGAILAAAACHLAYQAYLGSYRYYDDPANPYVYAHTSRDVFKIVEDIEAAADAAAGRDTYIQVICGGDDYWPLPWYLRGFDAVAWQSEIDYGLPPASLIITTADLEPAVIQKLYLQPPPGKKTLYVPLFDEYLELRPTVEMRGLVTKRLFDRMQQAARPLP
jgi:uncharacterized protein (TIGR03663 family)